jgi:hypothetical protein
MGALTAPPPLRTRGARRRGPPQHRGRRPHPAKPLGRTPPDLRLVSQQRALSPHPTPTSQAHRPAPTTEHTQANPPQAISTASPRRGSPGLATPAASAATHPAQPAAASRTPPDPTGPAGPTAPDRTNRRASAAGPPLRLLATQALPAVRWPRKPIRLPASRQPSERYVTPPPSPARSARPPRRRAPPQAPQSTCRPRTPTALDLLVLVQVALGDRLLLALLRHDGPGD